MRARPFALATIALAVVTSSSPGRAQDRASIEGDLHDYYGGERTTAFVAAGLGAASVQAGGLLVMRDGEFARGLGWPLVVLGAIEVLGGVGYAASVDGKERHYANLLVRDPAAFRREERAHIEGTTARFVYYRLIELSLLLGGAAAASYGFATDRDAWKGAGIGVAAFALPVAIIDTVNHARARAYAARLQSF